MGNQTSANNENNNTTINKIKNKAKVLSPLSPKKKQRTIKTYTPAPVKSKFDWLECYTPTPARPRPQALPTEYSFTDFELDQNSVLGEGGFAKVILATHKQTGLKAAVKVISKKMIPEDMRDYVVREPGVLAQLSHKNIVKLYLVHEDTNYIYMFLEYKAGGDMHSRLERDGIESEEIARAWFRQILTAVEFCHKTGYCHRDLKLENLLISGEGKAAKVLLIDFGFAGKMDPPTKVFGDFPGSVCYAAPELIRGIPYVGSSADVYSMGVILYTLLQGIYPFFSEDRRELVNQIVGGSVQFETYLSEPAQNLIKWMLAKNPEHRPTLEQIRNHPWIKPANVMNKPLNKIKETARQSLSPSMNRKRRISFN